MDIKVKAAAATGPWQLTDLLGRSMGAVSLEDQRFFVIPDGLARETMKGMSRGPFTSLDDALAKIEQHTRGTCRMDESPSPAIPADDLNASNDE